MRNMDSKFGAAVAVTALAVYLLLFSPAAGAAEIKLFTTADGLPSNWVTALAATPDGKFWAGTGNAGIFLFDPDKGVAEAHRASDGLSSDEVTSVALFRGKLYVGTAAALSVREGGKWTTIPRVLNVTMRNVRLAVSPDGKELWACAVYLAGGTVRFDGTEWKFMGGEGRGLFNDVQGFAFLPEGVLMASGAGMPYVHKGSDVEALRAGLPPANIFAAGAREGHWVIGTSKGLLEHDGKKWETASVPPDFSNAPVFAIAADGGAVVAGTSVGLLKLAGREAKALGPGDGLPASRVMAVASTRSHVVAGTASGLALILGW